MSAKEFNPPGERKDKEDDRSTQKALDDLIDKLEKQVKKAKAERATIEPPEPPPTPIPITEPIEPLTPESIVTDPVGYIPITKSELHNFKRKKGLRKFIALDNILNKVDEEVLSLSNKSHKDEIRRLFELAKPFEIEVKINQDSDEKTKRVKTFVEGVLARYEKVVEGGVGTSIPFSEKNDELEDSPEFLKNAPNQLLAYFEKYISLARVQKRELLVTNVNRNAMDGQLGNAYDDYTTFKTEQKSLIDQLPEGTEKNSLNREWEKTELLIKNIALTYEYQYSTMKNSFGLMHNPETIDSKIEPMRWRKIFIDEGEGSEREGYGLVSSNKSVEKEKGVIAKETFRTQTGPFWDMWDMAIQISANPKNSAEQRFAYGNNLANRMDDFYDFVLEKYFETPEGDHYKEYFKKYHAEIDGAKWKLIIAQIKQMFDVGNLLDDIYAVKAIKGSSLSHNPTMLSLNGEKKALWGAVYPISSAGYALENTQATISHTVMNLSMATEESIKDYYEILQKSGKPKEDIKIGTKEIREDVQDFVDTIFDQEDLLGKFDQLRGFPNFARSILEFDLSVSSRYFKVELVGWDYIWTELFKPLEALDAKAVEDKLGAWAKQGLGRAKLVSQAISLENFISLTQLYYSRVFAAFEKNKKVSVGKEAMKKIIRTGLISNNSREVQDLRFVIVDSIIKGASTVSYLGVPHGDIRFKREIMEMLGADFIHSSVFHEYDNLLALKESGHLDFVKRNRLDTIENDIQSQLEVKKHLIKGDAPKLLVRTHRRDQENKYKDRMRKNSSYPKSIHYIVGGAKEGVKAIFATGGRSGEIEAPYLSIKREEPAK